MIHLQNLEIRTDFFVLVLCIFLLSIQLLLCFKTKRLAVRLIPVFLCLISTLALTIMAIFSDGWDAFAYMFLAIGSSALLLSCGVAFAAWWIIKRIRS
jgi:hypothetical protein